MQISELEKCNSLSRNDPLSWCWHCLNGIRVPLCDWITGTGLWTFRKLQPSCSRISTLILLVHGRKSFSFFCKLDENYLILCHKNIILWVFHIQHQNFISFQMDLYERIFINCPGSRISSTVKGSLQCRTAHEVWTSLDSLTLKTELAGYIWIFYQIEFSNYWVW